MKIKNLAKIVLMITFFIILETKVYASTGIINKESVKLMKSPDSKTVLDLINEGDEVEVLETEEGWYKIKATTELGKVTGYVKSEELELEEEKINKQEPVENPIDTIVEQTTPVVSTEIQKVEENKEYTLNQEILIKTLPVINSREKAKISGNIKIIEIINDWARIENDIETGWIRTKLLEKSFIKVEEQPEDVQQEKPVEIDKEENPKEEEPIITEISKTGYVSTDGLRVRKGPSTSDEEITSLSKNDKVEIVGQIGNWYKIKLDKKTGYVSAKYISDTKVAETTSRSGSTLRDEQIPVIEEQKVENTVSATTNTIGIEVVEYAKQYLGHKYVSGGASPAKGFDCSGFTQYVYKHFGVSLNRTSRDQIKNGVTVEKKDLQLGDIVFFNNDSNTKIGHVGIYVGDGNFIHASNPSDGVKITTLLSGYYKTRYVGARRVI